MDLLVDLGIVKELTGRRRNRLFAYRQYLATLDQGTKGQSTIAPSKTASLQTPYIRRRRSAPTSRGPP
jgi:hypothetical protein